MPAAYKNLRATMLAILILHCFTGAAFADEPAPDPYASPDAWLCQPGRQDLCASGNDSTTISPDGQASQEQWKADPKAAIDCFYVYPTISEDSGGNSGMEQGAGEKRAVQHQFSRFASVCRPFAPMYRQVTLAGLRSFMLGKPIPMDLEMGYRDVLAAWKHYLKYDNRGRGVVLIGHSQGTRMLTQLIQREIEGMPSQALLVSALLLGSNLEVPAGQDKGGSFKHLPLCKSASQTGCVISYVSFRASSPPPANARFGRTKNPGMEVACVDPVLLSGIEVKSYMPTRGNLVGRPATQADWLQMASSADTPFVSLPGLLSAKCVNADGASYLSVATNAGAKEKRPTDVPGDLSFNGNILDDWGLHLVDVNLVAGNLIEIVRKQSAAYLGGSSAKN